ncbi:TetR family transcriptional regulator [Nocardiopsis coralli]|uniref:TetR family transcriptional regulator n=1 Tax=Nocardiopsis coralli TaxID=2772213 RepID=UPI002E2E52B1|nr:TetR family transcriptional regulator [Nocardiopsis coralli]
MDLADEGTGNAAGGRSRAAGTRARILTTAERLFAEHGLYAVSNRRIAEEAGQGNNTAVGYHFGTRGDLIRAIVRTHTDPVGRRRTAMTAELGDGAGARDWVRCLVAPVTEHLASLTAPTWYARFSAQVRTDPASRSMMADEALEAESLRRVVDGLDACLSGLSERTRAARGEMSAHLLVQMCAERERALAEGEDPEAGWDRFTGELVDALVGLWTAPETTG